MLCYKVASEVATMKKVFLGLSSALFVVGSVMGMESNEELSRSTIGRFNSMPALSKTLEVKLPQRRSSDPITRHERDEATKRAIGKWAHLVPKETQDEANVTKKVNDALEEVVIHAGLLERKAAMITLVELICVPVNRSYANYAHMVFADALPDCDDEERNKFGGMLAGIAGSKGGTASLFWSWYTKGYFDSTPLEAE